MQMEFEVPGTPEQVWHAIATGPGISSWFVPTEVQEHEGGAVAFHLGAGIDSVGHVTLWDPPVRFGYEEPNWSPGAPPLATEFIVEARAGGTCVVRVVHSTFASGEDWDEQIDGFESGWRSFFRVLRTYLTDFYALPCSAFRLMGGFPGPEDEAWRSLSGALNLQGVIQGDRCSTKDTEAPTLGGSVEFVDHGTPIHEVLLRVDEPAFGLVLIGAYTWGGKTHTALSFYFYGEGASTIVSRDEPLWQAWIKEQFPPAPATT